MLQHTLVRRSAPLLAGFMLLAAAAAHAADILLRVG